MSLRTSLWAVLVLALAGALGGCAAPPAAGQAGGRATLSATVPPSTQAATAERAPSARDDGTRPAVFYVAPNGNDAWSGQLPAPSSDQSDGPWATLECAQQGVRELKGGAPLTRSVTILLRGGTYALDKPLALNAADGGTGCDPQASGQALEAGERTVTYAAYPGEKPVLSGGQRITGWQVERLGTRTVWTTVLTDVQNGQWSFRQLYVNGERRPRPRWPAEGFSAVVDAPDAGPGGMTQDDVHAGVRRFEFRPGDIRDWRNLQDVELIMPHFWIDEHLPILYVNLEQNLVTLAAKSCMRLTDDYNRSGALYYAENVFEALAEPGQWYLDRPSGTLYYLPKAGEDLATTEFVAPRLTHLLRLEGSNSADPVECVRLEGLTFAYNESVLPPDAATVYYQAAHNVPGAVILRNAAHCALSACTFTHLGTYAIELLAGCQDIAITRCTLTDLGAGGIKVWQGVRGAHITDNEIGPGGLIYAAGVGVLIGNSGDNEVAHNHIHHLRYTGISVGWTWGYGASEARGNIIEYNHIHDIGQGYLSDMGGIYTLGVSPGTRLRNNVIHDVRARGYGGWGIYNDEGSADMLVEGNLVYGCKSAGYDMHYGRNVTVRNNVFALSETYQIERGRAEGHLSFTFENNIVYYQQGQLLGSGYAGGGWAPANAVFRNNLYYDASGRPVELAGSSLERWQALGMDPGSLIADPRFADAAHGDFCLRPDSPALQMGFVPLDLGAVGVRPIP